jgi:hypothetical protein
MVFASFEKKLLEKAQTNFEHLICKNSYNNQMVIKSLSSILFEGGMTFVICIIDISKRAAPPHASRLYHSHTSLQ